MKNTVTQPRVLAKVPSKSNPLKSYEIRLGGDGVVYCTCRAWITNKFCKHLEEYHSRSMGTTIQTTLGTFQASNSSPKIVAPNPNAVTEFFQTQHNIKAANKIYLTISNGIMRGVWE